MKQCLLYWLVALLSQSASAMTPLTWQTKQHVPVFFYRTHHAAMVTIHVAFKAGSAYDQQQFGLAALTAAMLNQGNHGMSASVLANDLAETGAVYAAAATRDLADFSLISITAPAKLQQALTNFSHILNAPDFPETALLNQKNQQLAAILNEKDSPQQLATNAFFSMLYPAHPYGHSILGTPDTLKALDRQAILNFYHHYYVPENALIVIVGALSKTKAALLADQLLASLPHGQTAPAIPLASATPQTAQVHHVPFKAPQTTLCLGQLGITHHDPRYFALIVGNYIFGGSSLMSLLGTEIREKRGLTYHINSDFSPMPGIGPFLISTSTKHQQTKEMEHLIQTLLGSFIQNGPTDEALKAAKQYLIGSFPLTLSSNTDIANTLLRLAFYHLPNNFLETYPAHIQSVSKTDIQQAFRALIHPNHFIEVTVGP